MSTAAITNDTSTMIDEATFLRISAEYKLARILEREKKIFFKAAHRLYAYGLPVEDFSAIVNKLADIGFCEVHEGYRGGKYITLVEHASNLQRELSKPAIVRAADESPALSDCLNNAPTE